MKLVFAYFKALMIELIRIPGVWVPVIVIPTLLFLFFGISSIDSEESAIWITLAYAAWGVMGVAFFQFGVIIAIDRNSPWETYLRTLPVSPFARFFARILCTFVFSLIISLLLFIESNILSSFRIDIGTVVIALLFLLLGSVPFVFLGIALGYWTGPKTAAPIANILWICLAYSSGIWGIPIYPIKNISPYLVFTLNIDTVTSSVMGNISLVQWIGLLLYSVAFGTMAFWGYLRDEGQRFQ
jgi:ABC-2 type transport system permease protein